MTFYVYAHLTRDTDEVFYIGKGCGDRHKSRTPRNAFWKAVAEKHQWYSKILVIFATEQEALDCERALIAAYGRRSLNEGPLTNFGEGGSRNAGGKLSEETRAKMSKAKTGVVFTEERRRRISEANKGKKGMAGDANPSKRPEVAKKISEAKKGVPKTAEHRAKLAAANLGKKRGPFSAEHRARLSEAKRLTWAKKKSKMQDTENE